MFYGNTPDDTRRLFHTSWKKYLSKEMLSPLEAQLSAVIGDHPEYHTLFAQNPDELSGMTFDGTNPFLHLGLHLTIRDQVDTNRPATITHIYHRLMQKYQDKHLVEHLMMTPLAECLWAAQSSQSQPDEQAYLNACLSLE